MDENSDSDSQQQQPPPSAAVESPRAPSDKPKEPTEYKDGTEKQKRDYSHVRVFGFPLLEFLQVLFDGLLVIAGVIGTIVIVRQLNVMEQQIADSKTAAEAQDKVIGRTLTALEQQAMAMTESIGPAAKEQAKASTDAATAMQDAATANKGIADSATKSASATEKLASATSEAAQASHSLAESATKSNVAAQRLADAAHEANIVTRDLVRAAQQTDETNRNVQGAFVLVRSFAAEQMTTYWVLHIEFENTGNTPTRNLVINSYCAAVPYDKAPHFGGYDVEPDVFRVDASNKTFSAWPRTAALLGPRQAAFIRSCVIGGCPAVR